LTRGHYGGEGDELTAAAGGADSTPPSTQKRNSISGLTTLSTSPPFVNQFDLPSGTLGYGPGNASLLGRQVSLQVVKRWGQ
jgi:hypothetical protein